MSTTHFVEDRIAAEVRRAELNGDTCRISRQVKEAQQAKAVSLPDTTPQSQQPQSVANVRQSEG